MDFDFEFDFGFGFDLDVASDFILQNEIRRAVGNPLYNAKEYVWIMYGLCMVYLWIMYGLCLDHDKYLMSMHELSIGYVYIKYGWGMECMDYV